MALLEPETRPCWDRQSAKLNQKTIHTQGS